MEWGRGRRRCFNSKRDPLTGITSNWLSSQSISSENFEHVIEELLSLIILFGADTSRGIGINHHFAPETDMMAQDVMPSYRHDAANSRLN